MAGQKNTFPRKQARRAKALEQVTARVIGYGHQAFSAKDPAVADAAWAKMKKAEAEKATLVRLLDLK